MTERLFAFDLVATLGGFTQAAQSLDASKSAVSKQVSRIEAYLGTQLLHRSTRSIRLTEEGSTLLGYSGRILGHEMPRYLRFEVGGARLRGFPSQQFRTQTYMAVQNDLLVSSLDVWSAKIRPLVYADWAFVHGAPRTGAGAGLQLYLKKVTVPALQVYAGYGFNPSGFSASVAIGPQF